LKKEGVEGDVLKRMLIKGCSRGEGGEINDK